MTGPQVGENKGMLGGGPRLGAQTKRRPGKEKVAAPKTAHTFPRLESRTERLLVLQHPGLWLISYYQLVVRL